MLSVFASALLYSMPSKTGLIKRRVAASRCLSSLRGNRRMFGRGESARTIDVGDGLALALALAMAVWW